jgi:hypothetical protein
MLKQLAERKSFQAVKDSMDIIEGRAWGEIIEAGLLPMEYMIVPLVMAFVLIMVPLVVRKDYGVPVRNHVLMVFSIFFCYVFASLLNIVLAAGISWGLSVYFGWSLGPDLFIFLAHPFYLIAPWILDSVPGTLSQIIYLVFIFSVLSAPNKYTAAADRAAAGAQKNAAEDDDWNRSACTMEMDRLTRLIGSKIKKPALINAIKEDISEYINAASFVDDDIKSGASHYKIVLVQAAGSLRKILAGDPSKPGASDAFLFVADELERMEHITPEEHKALLQWLSKISAENGKNAKNDGAGG